MYDHIRFLVSVLTGLHEFGFQGSSRRGDLRICPSCCAFSKLDLSLTPSLPLFWSVVSRLLGLALILSISRSLSLSLSLSLTLSPPL